jgi:hypothetical protein
MSHTERVFTSSELELIDQTLQRFETAIRAGRAAADLVGDGDPAWAVIETAADQQLHLLNGLAALLFPADFQALVASRPAHN